jgi:hypothetical protein
MSKLYLIVSELLPNSAYVFLKFKFDLIYFLKEFIDFRVKTGFGPGRPTTMLNSPPFNIIFKLC